MTVARDTQARLLAAWLVRSLPLHPLLEQDETKVKVKDKAVEGQDLRQALAAVDTLRVVEHHVSGIGCLG